ncbi:MAG TPA: transposase [Kofleriaceae bacterium]|nr:transposase [Kofleriaceae bacterium]
MHVSVRVLRSLPSLRGRHLWEAVRRALVKTCKKDRFRIVHFSVQGEHIHLLCEAADRRALSAGVQGFKISVAKRINARLDREGTVFPQRYHERIIESPTDCRATIAYILCNQRHHAYDQGATLPRGHVDPCSSARHFDGWTVQHPPPWKHAAGGIGDDAVCAPAESFLLKHGWRRGGGLISPDHIPALPPGAPPPPEW